MDPLIAQSAKLNYFDAAQYTWVVLHRSVVMAHTYEELDEMLVAHGDYATPLRTEHIKMPFDRMALLLCDDKLKPGQLGFLVTVDSHQGQMQNISQWSGELGGNCRVTEFDFVSGKTTEGIKKAIDKRDIFYDNDWKRFDERNEDPTTAFLDKTLVRFDARISIDMRNDLLKFFVPGIKTVTRYIAAASAGLLAGEQPVYHRPTGHSSNAKRVRKGKAPLYEWTTVQLERKTPELPTAPKGGTHASPRLHQRRGHWVTSKLGKKFWRRESVVGDPEKGMIFHDYKGGTQDARH